MLKSSELVPEDDEILLDHALLEEVDHKYFYEGTLRGWLSKYQKLVVMVALATVLVTVVAVLGVVWASRALQSTETDDDDACWPRECFSSIYTEAETTFYYEPPVDDTSHINATLIGDWDFVYPTPTNRDVYSVASGTNLVIAVGQDNTQLVMESESEWVLEEPIDRDQRFSSFESVYYAAGRFWASTKDGRGYSRLDLPDQHWTTSEHSFSDGIATDPSGTLFVGIEGDTAWFCDTDISLDLWTEVTLPGNVATLSAASYLNGVFLLVGTVRRSVHLYDELQFTSWASGDGEHWVMGGVSDDTLYNTNIVLAAKPTREAHSGRWLAFADRLMYSLDGQFWTPFAMSPWNEFSAPKSMACSIDYCVAVTSGMSGQSMVSLTADGGITWLSAILSRDLHEVIFDEFDSFLVVGNGGTILRGRMDGDVGVIWSEEGAAVHTEEVIDVAFLSGQFIATTGSQQLLVSDDGQSWNTTQAPPFRYVAHGEQTFAGITSDGTYLHVYVANNTMDDWNLVARFEGDYDLRQFSFDGHQFMGTGRRCILCAGDDDDDDDDVYEPVTLQSDDGAEWDVLSAEGVEETFLVQVLWNPIVGNFLGRSSDGRLYTSRNAEDWAQASSSAHWYRSITVDQTEGTYIALGRDRDDPAVRVSEDGGHTWTTLGCSPDPLMSVIMYDYATKDNYLSGGFFCRATLQSQHLACNSVRMEVNSCQDMAIGVGVAVLLTEGGLITAAVDTLEYTVVC